MAKRTILDNQTTNGNSESFSAIGQLNGSAKAYAFLTVYGEFDGANATLQYQADDGNWYQTGDALIENSCAYFIEMTTADVPYRLSISGAGASTSISATVYEVA